MPRIDDYKQALNLGKIELSGRNPDLIARFSGSQIHRDKGGSLSLSLNFLNREVSLAWHDMAFSYRNSEEELPIQQQILLLHYLQGAFASSGSAITGEWIAFQDVPDGKFYLDAFHRRAKIPMVQAFGDRPELLVGLATNAYGAVPFDQGDISVAVKALPLVPVALIIWRGDEEFPPEGNILFDRNISDILSAEDVAWLSGMVVYPLVGMAGK
ncbi:MAG: DUF3786 domain-containing protein [Pseudomonadota bacterium]